ncbi:MAG: patatin-like phospholipase family protein, partial [Anaerolineae bacterium]
GNRILVDGGLVNPVPVSAVRKMGAEFVIAVDLNHDILDKKGVRKPPSVKTSARPKNQNDEGKKNLVSVWNKKLAALDIPALNQVKQWLTKKEPLPGIFEVLISSLNIMELQITDRNLKIDAPELLIRPKLGHINFLEINRAQEAIEEGYRETVAQLNSLPNSI